MCYQIFCITCKTIITSWRSNSCEIRKNQYKSGLDWDNTLLWIWYKVANSPFSKCLFGNLSKIDGFLGTYGYLIIFLPNQKLVIRELITNDFIRKGSRILFFICCTVCVSFAKISYTWIKKENGWKLSLETPLFRAFLTTRGSGLWKNECLSWLCFVTKIFPA